MVGEPLEEERHDPVSGDGLQATTMGLMVWRKADNWTAFTDGYRTWVSGPNGLQQRLNSERFDWERDSAAGGLSPNVHYRPAVIVVPTPSETYPFLRAPKGFLLHGSRSGRAQPVAEEYQCTVRYAAGGANDLGWNFTIGEDAVAEHIGPARWGWNSYRASMYYVALEFAQGNVEGEITDGQVRAAAWAIQRSREVWPSIPLNLVTHAELEQTGETGRVDGKTDVYPFGDARADRLRERILLQLGG